MTDSLQKFWGELSSVYKIILFLILMVTSFSSGQLVMNPQVKINKELAESNRVIAERAEEVARDNRSVLDGFARDMEFLTRVTVATAKKNDVDTEEIRRNVEAEFRQLEAMSK